VGDGEGSSISHCRLTLAARNAAGPNILRDGRGTARKGSRCAKRFDFWTALNVQTRATTQFGTGEAIAPP